jgi:hypothetical protein
MTFLLKTLKQKRLLRYFARVFLIFRKIFWETFLIFRKICCLEHPRLFCIKNKMDLFIHKPCGIGLMLRENIFKIILGIKKTVVCIANIRNNKRISHWRGYCEVEVEAEDVTDCCHGMGWVGTGVGAGKDGAGARDETAVRAGWAGRPR